MLPSAGYLKALLVVQDTVTGFLLCGVGNVDTKKKTNYLVVDGSTIFVGVTHVFGDYFREHVVLLLCVEPISYATRIF